MGDGRRTLLGLACLTIALTAAPLSASAQKMSEETLEHGGRTRHFLVHDFSGGKPAPTVIVLHGGGGNSANAADMTQFDVVAAREHLLAVYPDGTGALPGGRVETWNAGHCCAYAMENKVDDVGFISKLIDGLVASGRADAKRIYVTGMSNGGMMAHRLARELPDKIAAIAPVVGAVFGDEPPPSGAVSALIIVGADDHTLPGAGGKVGGDRKDGAIARLARPPADHDIAPAKAAADYWVKTDGCRDPVESSVAGAKLVSWSRCRDGTEVDFYTVANNGHAWPGGRPGRAEADPPSTAFSASETMWAFFKRHSR
ncbi:MAG: polyhydroxybutyrate depolymerase [Alphaproteobacteria bacterium]|nr:polyhydroxybutyrate depolymerase [Alphaproteobacteria bacterium]